MDDILHVKVVVIDTLVDLKKNDSEELKAALAGLFAIPLILFDSAYQSFIEKIAKASDSYDNWLCLQAQIYTDLGPERKRLMDDACATIEQILKGTPGGESGDVSIQDNISYRAALILRVYGCDTAFNEGLPTPPAPEKKE